MLLKEERGSGSFFILSGWSDSEEGPREEDREDELNVVGQSEDIICSSSITRTANDCNNEATDGYTAVGIQQGRIHGR